MTNAHRKAFDKLKKMNIAVRSSEDFPDRGVFWIWTEGVTEETEYHMDYYSNYWGSEKVNKILKDAGLYFEWYNPAYANVYEA